MRRPKLNLGLIVKSKVCECQSSVKVYPTMVCAAFVPFPAPMATQLQRQSGILSIPASTAAWQPRQPGLRSASRALACQPASPVPRTSGPATSIGSLFVQDHCMVGIIQEERRRADLFTRSGFTASSHAAQPFCRRRRAVWCTAPAAA
uniref:(northern house mosquito) hypothetical protein n=1 Tax=Culex pipiens TaxID=7175 RepID=A0A8D8K616_CULPI